MGKKEKIKLSLIGDISYHSDLVLIFGSINNAIYFQRLCYLCDMTRRGDGFIYKTKDDMRSETGLTREEQDKCRKELVSFGVLDTKILSVFGVPTLHYKINIKQTNKILDFFYKEVDKYVDEEGVRHLEIKGVLECKFKNSINLKNGCRHGHIYAVMINDAIKLGKTLNIKKRFGTHARDSSFFREICSLYVDNIDVAEKDMMDYFGLRAGSKEWMSYSKENEAKIINYFNEIENNGK